MVKILPSNAEGAGSIPGQGVKVPHPLWPTNQNILKKKKKTRNNIVTNSIKTLKMVHIKKKSFKQRVYKSPCVCVCVCVCVLCALVAQSCLTLCDPTDCSPPGFSVHGILQAQILEWIDISFSRGTSQPRDRTLVGTARDR